MLKIFITILFCSYSLCSIAQNDSARIIINDSYSGVEMAPVMEISAPNNEIDQNIVFTKVEIEPIFPGGSVAWLRYVERNLNANVALDNGAPAGKYTAVVKFIVDKDGTISDVIKDTNLGYGMEEELIRLIKRGPKWMPAQQNGRLVASYRKQPVTFTVQEK